MTGSAPATGRRVRAVTLDYWDTLYTGASTRERVAMRRRAVGELLAAYGRPLTDAELERVYLASAEAADRWWREEHRGYTTAERLRHLLTLAELTPRDACEHVATCARVVDEALDTYPPPLLDGAAAFVRTLAARMPIAIISDTGFASGEAQDRLLARDGLKDCFAARIYSADIGWAKPRREMFDAAMRTLGSLGITAEEVVHIGDIERTDVRGALSAGMRAIRLDAVRDGGPSEAELVAKSYDEVLAYLG